MSDLDPKIVEEVYLITLQKFRKAAKAQGRDDADAGEVAAEAVTRLMEAHRKTPIEKPLNWALHTAGNLWKDLRKDDVRKIPYGAVREDVDDVDPNINPLIAERITERLVEPRSPETITEQRDLLQKIDPDWEKHMEEGYDFTRKHEMDRNTRRQIQRRARALERENKG